MIVLLSLLRPALAEVDNAAWQNLAANVENMLDDGGGTDKTLADMRAQIAEYRESFDSARNQNTSRIGVVREQLAALGPAPEGENAEPEAASVAAKREELNKQLQVLQAPAQAAEADFLRADALIGQIDEALRARQAENLMTVRASPLNPANWPPAFADLRGSVAALADERLENAAARSWPYLRQILPLAGMVSLLGMILIIKGRKWSAVIVDHLRRSGLRGVGIWAFIASLLRIVLPLTGVALLTTGITLTDVLGPKGVGLIQLIPLLGVLVLGSRWLADRLFARHESEALLCLSTAQRAEARFYVSVITISIAGSVLLSRLLGAGGPSPDSEPVLQFPLMLISCFALYRIGRLLRGYSDANKGPSAEGIEPSRVSNICRVVRGLGTGALGVAMLVPLLLAAGYFAAADALLRPYALSLALLGLVMVLQRFAAVVYGAVTGQGDKAREALMPVLIGLALLLAVTPLLALAWGARMTDLTEIWSAFLRGVPIGNSRISPTNFLAFALIFTIGYVLTRLIQGAMRSNVLPKTRIDVGGQNAIVSGLGYVGVFLAAILAITGAGIDLSSLAIVAGALSVGIGFGLQNIVSNFVSGIILLIERPISEGDWIEVGGQMGYVRAISVRSTRIETFDRTDVIVPNADLVSGTVTNFTRGNTVGRIIVPVGVAYGTDTRRVEEILTEIARAEPLIMLTPAPSVLFMGFGADSLDFQIRAILRDVNFSMKVKSDLNHAIAKRFVEENIEIPFAQRDVWLRNPETLHSESDEK